MGRSSGRRGGFAGVTPARLAVVEAIGGQLAALGSSIPPPLARDEVANSSGAFSVLEALSNSGHRLRVTALPGQQDEFAIYGQGAFADYRFMMRQTGGVLQLAGMERHGIRRAARVPAPPAVEVSFLHPLTAERRVSRRVVQLSCIDFVCECDPDFDRLFVGLQLPQITLRWKGGTIDLDGQVVSLIRQDHPTATIAIRGPSVMARLWAQEVTPVVHPGTELGESTPEELWDLFADSGYFELSDKRPHDFESLRRAFAVSSRKLALAPELGGQLNSRSAHGVDCSVTVMRTWQRASLLYHVARRKHRPLGLSGNQSLYRAYVRSLEHVFQDTDVRWLVVYIQKNGAPFTRLLHKDFVSQYDDGRMAAVVPFRAMEASCTAGAAGREAASRWDVGTATAEEREALCDWLARNRPPAYVDALDLGADRLVDAPIAKAWKNAGMAYGREILVARKNGKAVAAAVLETAEEGLHLFALLDVARTFPLTDAGQEAFPALLEAARGWYAGRGKDRFVYFDEWFGTAAEEAGFASLGDAWTTVMSIDLLPELHETLLGATSPSTTPRSAPTYAPPRQSHSRLKAER